MYSVSSQIASSGNLLPVDLDALVEAENIGRRVKTRLVACRLKNRGEHRAGRALAVGAGDMDEFAGALGVIQFVEQRVDALKTRMLPFQQTAWM